MLGIYNYLCTILDVHQVVHLCTLLVLLVLSDTLDPKIPTFCKFDYLSLLLVGNSFCVFIPDLGYYFLAMYLP